MAFLLRSLPAIVNRSKSFIFNPFPLVHLNFNPPLKLKPVPKRYVSSSSSLSPASSSSSVSSTETLTSNPSEEALPIPALDWVSRTACCGNLTESDVGKRVRLCGWVALHRVHGGLSFLNLRDHTGIVQITTLPDNFPDAHAIVNDLRLEYVVSIEGVVRSRPSVSINKKMKTGSIEVVAEDANILNTVRAKLPFLVTTADDATNPVKEEIRLRVVKLIRRYLEDMHAFVEVFLLNFNEFDDQIVPHSLSFMTVQAFLSFRRCLVMAERQIETPILSRSTPEGARDLQCLLDIRDILCAVSKSTAVQTNAHGFWFR